MASEGIRFECPGCGKAITAPANSGGRAGDCPNCGHSLTVPSPVHRAGNAPTATVAVAPPPRAVVINPPSAASQQVVIVQQPAGPSVAGAALLELLPGMFLGIFGIGHIYAGRVGLGIMVMLGYWFGLAINIALCFVLVGFVTLPLFMLLTLILSPILAASEARASGGR